MQFTVKPRYKGDFCIYRIPIEKFYRIKSFISDLYLRELFLSTCPLSYYNIIGPKIKKKNSFRYKTFLLDVNTENGF